MTHQQREDERRFLADQARSHERNERWLRNHGYIIDPLELFVHGCGPVEVTMTREWEPGDEKFHCNRRDNPRQLLEDPVQGLAQVMGNLLGNAGYPPGTYVDVENFRGIMGKQ